LSSPEASSCRSARSRSVGNHAKTDQASLIATLTCDYPGSGCSALLLSTNPVPSDPESRRWVCPSARRFATPPKCPPAQPHCHPASFDIAPCRRDQSVYRRRELTFARQSWSRASQAPSFGLRLLISGMFDGWMKIIGHISLGGFSLY